MEERADERLGTVTIAPGVLVTIASLSALSVPGVRRMSERASRHMRILGVGGIGQGTRVQVVDGAVSVDLHIIVEGGVNMLKVGRAIQATVTRAIQDMVGMEVREVNVYIDDVEFPAATPPQET